MRKKSDATMQQIRAYLDAYTARHAVTPSIRTVSAGTGIPRPTVQRYLAAMGQSGEIVYSGGHMETPLSEKIRPAGVTVALLGEVACGLPTYEEEHVEMYLRLPAELVGEERCYLLRARGESMIDAGIESGDLVLVRKQSTAHAGEIAVVLVGDEVTLKRYYPEPDKRRIRLHPENKEMEDLYVTDAEIQGVAVKVIKNLR